MGALLGHAFVDAMLPNGSRLHVVIPDITRTHWSVNIRKFVVTAGSLDELVGLGSLTRQAARFLEAAVVAGLNVIVAGGTQAGKPTSRQDTRLSVQNPKQCPGPAAMSERLKEVRRNQDNRSGHGSPSS